MKKWSLTRMQCLCLLLCECALCVSTVWFYRLCHSEVTKEGGEERQKQKYRNKRQRRSSLLGFFEDERAFLSLFLSFLVYSCHLWGLEGGNHGYQELTRKTT